jgi:hypothetical protein
VRTTVPARRIAAAAPAGARLLAALGLLLLLLVAAPLLARPGGGESFSGGGSSGGGSGGGGDGGCVFLLIRLWFELVIRYPVVGIPLTVVIIVLALRHAKKTQLARVSSSWDSGPPGIPRPLAPAGAGARDLDVIRQLDPDFSAVAFEDFAYALFARAHESRANGAELDALAPYLSAAVRAHLAGRQPVGAPVSGVVIGAMKVLEVALPGASPPPAGAPQVVVGLEIEANLTVGAPAAQHTHYLRERWRLVRDAGVRSKPPAKVRTFQCPNCGAPLGAQNSERCEYCGQATAGGRFDWSVESIVLVHLEERPPAIGADVQEVGTDYPTIVHPEAGARWAELLAADPATNDQTLVARLGLIYGELNAAWTAADLPRIRPFVSDSLFGYLRYWIDAYEAQGLRNVLEGMRIERWKIAKVVRDRYFDAVTFRIWGSGRDYLVRKATGERLSGDPRRDRAYSEYWTLIRGAAVRGAPRTDKACPNCGAALDVNMAGECAHCGSRVTSGDFDWVLSKIEQDDSYSG